MIKTKTILLCSTLLLDCNLSATNWAHCCVHTEKETGKRDNSSLNDKQNLIQVYGKLPRTSQQDTAEKLGSGYCLQSTKRNSQTASDENRKQTYTGKAPVVKVTFMKWIDNALSRNAPLSSPGERKAVPYFETVDNIQ